MTPVPDATALCLAAAFEVMREAGLQPILIGLPTIKTTGNSGYMIAAQEPAAGFPAESGARVALAATTQPLSFGGTLEGPPIAAPGTPAPDVIGVEIEEAMRRVTDGGFIAVVFQPERGIEQLNVSKQEPRPGQPVERFREVGLWLD
jgi:hypothetical protein